MGSRRYPFRKIGFEELEDAKSAIGNQQTMQTIYFLSMPETSQWTLRNLHQWVPTVTPNEDQLVCSTKGYQNNARA